MPSQKNDSLQLRISEQLEAGLPLVLYRKPFEDQVSCLLQKNADLNFLENYSNSGFVFAPFNLDAAAPVLLKVDESFEYPLLGKTSPEAGSAYNLKEDKEGHFELIEKAIEEIEKGTFKKVVVSRPIDVKIELNPVELFHHLAKTYASAFCYLFHHPKVGTWLGASPELLVAINQKDFETSSLAGTLPAKGDIAVKWTVKELQEQQMVTDFIEEQLKMLNLKCSISGPKNQKAGALWHLKSVIKGELDSFDDLKRLITALHPTPAVCGLPKNEAQKFILDTENYQREYYTGFLGELNIEKQKAAKFFVNLRCMQIKEGSARIYVGGGITSDSNPSQELQETINKSKTMLDLF